MSSLRQRQHTTTRAAREIGAGKQKGQRCGASIADMPSEIIYAIIAYLADLRHVVDCCIALGRLPDGLVLARAASNPKPFLERGAPIKFVCALARTHGSIVPASWLDAAVLGGRRDVVAWLHDVADIDRMCGVDIDTWPTIPCARRKHFWAHARRLLKMAASRGHVGALEWLLDFYDAPRFAAKPLIDENVVDSLCGYAITSGGAAVEIVDALHRRFYGKERCRCSLRLAYAAARADRTDVIEWMYAAGCRARPDDNTLSEVRAMANAAIDGKACSVIRWLKNRTSHDLIVERLLCEILMPHTPRSQRAAIDMVKRAGLFWSCVLWFFPCLIGISAGVYGNPQGHPFVRAVATSLAFVSTLVCIVLLCFVLFCIPSVGVWAQNMLFKA